jgi:hypothetical protein
MGDRPPRLAGMEGGRCGGRNKRGCQQTSCFPSLGRGVPRVAKREAKLLVVGCAGCQQHARKLAVQRANRDAGLHKQT